MQIYSDRGLFIGKIAIDPSGSCSAETALITHGHSDHVSIRKGRHYLFSSKTKAIIESRFSLPENSTSLRFKQKLQLNGTTISLHNSGHILGSSQVLLEGDQAIAVTSDFKMQDSLIQKKAKPLPCDVLVIESTFGLPCYSFPEREALYNDLAFWVKEKTKSGIAVLAGYSLGKAQELTAICNKHAGIAPLVHESIFKNNKVYERQGTKLGDYIKLEHNLKDSPVIILPPSLVNHNLMQVLEHSLRKPVYSALASGWGFRRGYNKTFPLSDHADFPQLMQYIKAASPKLVLTMHGFEREFASYVQRRLGIAAKPLGMHSQKTLTEFA